MAKAQVNVFWDCFLERCFFLYCKGFVTYLQTPKRAEVSGLCAVFQIDSCGKFWVWVVWRPFSAQNTRIGSFLRQGGAPLEVGDEFVFKHTPEGLAGMAKAKCLHVLSEYGK